MRYSFRARKISKNGVGAIEMIVYIAIFVTLSIVVVQSIISMMSAFSKAKAIRRVTLDGETALERVIRETRLASSINVPLSTFNTSSSHVTFATVKSASDSTPAQKEFYFLNNRIAFQEDSGMVKYITSPDSAVSSFYVSRIATGKSEALKIILTIEKNDIVHPVAKSFLSTVILRGGY